MTINSAVPQPSSEQQRVDRELLAVCGKNDANAAERLLLWANVGGDEIRTLHQVTRDGEMEILNVLLPLASDTGLNKALMQATCAGKDAMIAKILDFVIDKNACTSALAKAIAITPERLDEKLPGTFLLAARADIPEAIRSWLCVRKDLHPQLDVVERSLEVIARLFPLLEPKQRLELIQTSLPHLKSRFESRPDVQAMIIRDALDEVDTNLGHAGLVRKF